MSGTPARQVTLYSNAGHTLTHMATILYATAVLHLPGVLTCLTERCLGCRAWVSCYTASRLYRLAGSVTVGVRLA